MLPDVIMMIMMMVVVMVILSPNRKGLLKGIIEPFPNQIKFAGSLQKTLGSWFWVWDVNLCLSEN